ncbi:MAG: CBS domain-containing protein [Gammaproteobacteria bacterium]|nr:CBS domain-containing protein [Gammaproteobacteria bacterium]
MSTVKDILKEKRSLWHLQPDQTVMDAVELLIGKNVGALVVIEDNKLAGIISERDFTRKIIVKRLDPETTLIKDIMTRDVRYVTPDQSVDTCLALINKHRVRHLPVIENDKVIGMISIGDVVKHVVEDKQTEINHLEQVISWGENY